MENWVNVYEFNKGSEKTMEWLFELLDEEKIPHKEERKENWFGYRMPIYQQNIIIYVPEEYKEKVELYIKEYNNPDNIVYEEVEELKNAFNDEEEKREYKNRNIAKKILAIIPFAMILIVIICGIIMG